MAIKKNTDGKTATRKDTGVTGGPTDKSRVTAKKPALAQSTPRVAKRTGRKPGLGAVDYAEDTPLNAGGLIGVDPYFQPAAAGDGTGDDTGDEGEGDD